MHCLSKCLWLNDPLALLQFSIDTQSPIFKYVHVWWLRWNTYICYCLLLVLYIQPSLLTTARRAFYPLSDNTFCFLKVVCRLNEPHIYTPNFIKFNSDIDQCVVFPFIFEFVRGVAIYWRVHSFLFSIIPLCK